MRSFTESVFAIRFRDDVAPVVVAAFRDHAAPALQATIPELESLTTAAHRHAAEDVDSLLSRPDEVPEEVWAWVWHAYMRPNPCAYLVGDPAVSLSRPYGRLTLTARLHIQDMPMSTAWWLRPLGRYAEKQTVEGYRDLVGYLRYESDPQPTLLYLGDTGFESEPDLFAGTDHDHDELEVDDELIDVVRRFAGANFGGWGDPREQAIELLQMCPSPGPLLARSVMFRMLVTEAHDDALFAAYRRVGEAHFVTAVDAVITAHLPPRDEEEFLQRQRVRDYWRQAQAERLERFRRFE
jgi:hypothetical protein